MGKIIIEMSRLYILSWLRNQENLEGGRIMNGNVGKSHTNENGAKMCQSTGFKVSKM